MIRRAVAPLLLHGTVDADTWTQAAQADEDAWRLFLRVERCALPLDRALTRRPLTVAVSAPFRSILARVAQQEGARVLVVRAHLRTAAALAASLDAPVIVLKGGVLAAGDDALDLSDLDLLVPTDRLDDLAAALRHEGWVATAQVSERIPHNLVSQGVTIAIHRALGVGGAALDGDIWNRSELLEAVSPLRQLGPRDALCTCSGTWPSPIPTAGSVFETLRSSLTRLVDAPPRTWRRSRHLALATRTASCSARSIRRCDIRATMRAVRPNGGR